MKNIKVDITEDKIDYKDAETLKKFLNAHAGLQSRRRTGTPAHIQRTLETAVKRARFLGLLPFVSR